MVTTELAPKPALAIVFAYYLGERDGGDGKPVAVFAPVDLADKCKTFEELDKVASQFTFKTRDMPRVVGVGYEIKAELYEDGRINRMVPAAQYKGDIGSLPDMLKAACESRDKAAKVARRARKEYADLSKDKSLDRLIRPLRMRYEGTDSIGRMALEVVILHALRGG